MLRFSTILKSSEITSVAIGGFDGMHLGHMELVKKLERLEKERLKSGREKTNIKEEVFKLFKKGFSQREIAKHLGLSEAEVEVILSAKKVKQG